MSLLIYLISQGGLVGPFWAGLPAAHKWMGCYIAWHAMIRISVSLFHCVCELVQI